MGIISMFKRKKKKKKKMDAYKMCFLILLQPHRVSRTRFKWIICKDRIASRITLFEICIIIELLISKYKLPLILHQSNFFLIYFFLLPFFLSFFEAFLFLNTWPFPPFSTTFFVSIFFFFLLFIYLIFAHLDHSPIRAIRHNTHNRYNTHRRDDT